MSGCTCGAESKSLKVLYGPTEIVAVIPHGRDGIHIDGVTSLSVRGRCVEGVRTVRKRDCPGHFDPTKDLPMVVPSATLQEMGYQVALYLMAQIWPEKMAAPTVATVKNCGFALLGDKLLFRVKITRMPTEKRREGRAVISCTSLTSGRDIMSNRFGFTCASYALFRRMTRMIAAKNGHNGAGVAKEEVLA